MRDIKYIVLHCTATPQSTTIESIQRYWKGVMKWNSPGYHFIIKPNGSLVNIHPIEKPSNGVAGHNFNSIHISYIGGVIGDKAIDNRTDAQRKAMYEVVKMFKGQFPKAEVKGHRDFEGVKKECPSFEVSDWLKEVNL